MENFSKLERALKIMGKVVPNYVRNKMDAKYKGDAFQEACKNLGKNTPSRQKLESKGWNKGIDLYIGLKIICKQQELFKKEMGENVWSYCLRVSFYRNFQSHNTPEEIAEFNKDTRIDAYLEEMAFFCQAIDAESAKRIRALKEESVSSQEETPETKDSSATEKKAVRLTRGMRGNLDEYCNLNTPVEISMYVKGGSVYDFICFGLDSSNQLSDERYMIFYNQEKSPAEEIVYSQNGKTAHFCVDFGRLPDFIEKLSFTVCIDGEGTMNEVVQHTVKTAQAGKNVMLFELTGNDFQNLGSVISIEFYRKNGQWKFIAVGNGFDGNLSKLLQFFGGTEAD